jgi:outer membrane biosynthesis protein TonB
MSSLASDGFFDSRLKRGLLVSAAVHVVLIVLALAVTERKAAPMFMGGSCVTVEMVTLAIPEAASEVAVEENPAVEEAVEEVVEAVEAVEETPVEETPVEENPVEVSPVEETPVEENPVEETPVDTNPQVSDAGFVSVGSEGEAGDGAPGPATYEGRVFNAIRRNFRTSVLPPLSYRIVFTVELDGTSSWEVVRQSGEPAFDRAVEHAISMASIPPVPPGRTRPVVLNIEFLGPE